MPVPNIVAADSKVLDEAEAAQLGDGEPRAEVSRDRGNCLRLKGMRPDSILVRMLMTSRSDSTVDNLFMDTTSTRATTARD